MSRKINDIYRKLGMSNNTTYEANKNIKPKVNSQQEINVAPPKSGTELFHNPYHFVPVKLKNHCNEWSNADDFKDAKNPEASHASYQSNKKTYSGRILCDLIAKSPIFVGAEKKQDATTEQPAILDNFKLNEQAAIPATSLKGVISSVAEAASQSSLRVLDDTYLSRRATMQEGLGALGILEKEPGTGKLMLKPLALPVVTCNSDGKSEEYEEKWQTIFKTPILKAYVNGYEGVKKQSRNNNIKVLSYIDNTFLFRYRPNSFSADNEEHWYLKLGEVKWDNKKIIADEPYVKESKNKNGSSYQLLGQKSVSSPIPITHDTFQTYDKDIQNKFTKGIIRVLGIDNRENNIPISKKHEIFIPLDGNDNKLLDVEQALSNFHHIADQCSKFDETTPFEVKGKHRTEKNKKSIIRLKHGDIVFFDINEKCKVTEISVSSIWRKKIPGTIYDYFRAVDKTGEILPFNNDRHKISPAELLFGFVEQRQKNKNYDDPALSYAGKVRFSHASLADDQDEDCYGKKVVLNKLDSPKPPSPALYFKSKSSDAYINKAGLDPKLHIPQGRKFYLHHPQMLDNDEVQAYCGLTDQQIKDDNFSKKQHIQICPIKSRTRFQFHLDFNNLSEYELGLLLYALKPRWNYLHKIGMGKPLGLGSVDITPHSVVLIDRQQRYATDNVFDDPRYHQAYSRDTNQLETALETGLPKTIQNFDHMQELKKSFEKTMDKDVKNALELIGDPNSVKHNVHYPQVVKNNNEEHFRWFVANDVGSGSDKKQNKTQPAKQKLKPITEKDNIIPPLKKNLWAD